MAITSSWDIRHNGVLFKAGEIVTLSNIEEKELVESGRAQYVPVVDKDQSSKGEEQTSMSVKEIEEFLKTAEYIDDVEDLLKAEQARIEPRKSAIKLLEDWLKEAEQDEDLQGDDSAGQPDSLS